MFYQKCIKCGSEWNSIKNMQECPFCGNIFEMKKSNFKNIEDALQYIFSIHNVEIIKQKNIFISLLADYAPSLEKERKVLRMALDSDVYVDLLSVNRNDTNAQSAAQAKAIKTLNTEQLMDPAWAQRAVSWLISQLNWTSAISKTEHCFVPCNSSSSANNSISSEKDVVKNNDSSIEIGKRIYFGKYPFESDGTKKPIEWEILDIKNDKILLWSTMCLDVSPYHGKRQLCNWNDSDLRNYIRENIFLNAFENLEQDAILTTEILPSYNPNTRRSDGKPDTWDKLFILSDEELDRYQLRPFQVKGIATPYAKRRGIFCAANGDAYYWVRTPGSCDETQMFVGKDGKRDAGGNYVNIAGRGIRPAVWVDYLMLKKLFNK